MSEERIVIVGGGPAGQAAAGAYRKAGGKGTVAILAREPDPPYERPPLTKDFLRGESGREALPLVDAGWYKGHGIDLRTGIEVAEIDLGKADAWTAAGEAIPFDRLLLATGADPTVPPVPGADGPAVQTVRRLGAEVAAEIAAWLEGLGVEILPEVELASIRPAGDRSARARFADGDERVADRVLLALGVERNDGLVASVGLPVEDGAQVGPTMGSADPRLLAAGDVAFAFNGKAGRRLRVEHWGEALKMGEVAGKTMAGQEAAWDVAPGFWSEIGNHRLKYVGWGDGHDESRFERGEEGAFACWYGRDGELVGVVSHLDDAAYERGRELIEERAPWS